MQSISELLQKFKSRSIEREVSVKLFNSAVFSVLGIEISSKHISFGLKKVTLGREVPSPIRNMLILKKNQILLKIKESNPKSILEDIG